jgi:hypothetical protein
MTFTWVFARGGERLEIRRSGTPTATKLVVWSSDGELKTYDFSDHAALVNFHAEFEQRLSDKSWSFVGFEPERRAGADRRAVARAQDRRTSARRRVETSGV